MSISLAAPIEAQGSTESRQRNRLAVSWVTVVVFTVALAYADGFWVTSALRAIGATANTQGPFLHWLRDSTMMLPPIVLAVLAALGLTRRWLHGRREIVQLAGAALLVILVSSAVSIAELSITTAADYKYQVNQLTHPHTTHFSTPAAAPTPAAATPAGTCADLCAAKHSSLVVHVRAVGYGTLALLITNVVLVIWILAVRGGRLWAPRQDRTANARAR
jgi:hypothetical protein